MKLRLQKVFLFCLMMMMLLLIHILSILRMKQVGMTVMKRMMEGLLLMIIEGMNLMPVVLVVRRRNLQRRSQKRKLVSKPSTSRKKSNDDGSKNKKQKKEKDPNSPEMEISAFIYFSRSEMENVKKSNPGIAFTDVGKIIGERWIKLSAEEKEPFEAMAKADKKRYSKQISDYKNPQLTAMGSGNESEST